MRILFGSPRSNNFMIGMRSPSSKTSRASAERIRPPISALWQVLANNATNFPPRKIGVVIVMSLICPAVCHGSLVMRTSPASSLSGGNAARKCFIEVAMALIWPGVPLSDCAIIRPLVSNSPQAKSWLSRTIVLNAVRISVSCCSLATDMKRFQITSRVTGSIALFSIAQLHDDIQSIIHPRMPARADDQRRFPLLDDRRPGELHPRLESVAVVDHRFHVTFALGEISEARAFARVTIHGIARHFQIPFRPRPTRDDPPVDHFQRHVGSFAPIQGSIGLFKGLLDSA